MRLANFDDENIEEANRIANEVQAERFNDLKMFKEQYGITEKIEKIY